MKGTKFLGLNRIRFLHRSGRGGLNVGSLRAKNMALLGKWWGRLSREGESLWVRVIKSIHGASGGIWEGRNMGLGLTGGGEACGGIL